MADFLTRVKVVLANLSTWLIAAAAIVGIFAEEIVTVLPDDWEGSVSQTVTVVLAVIAAAVAIIRRVTPVIGEQHGLLPVAGPVIPSANVKLTPEV